MPEHIAISSISLHFEYDLVAARRRARQVSALLGFDEQEQTRIATVASEIARNALRYGGGGRFEFAIENRDRVQSLVMTISDRGAGIRNLQDVLDGRYRSTTGMGLGILGARRLMDDFTISTAADKGTVVVMKKRLSRAAPPVTPQAVRELVDKLARQKAESPVEEIQQQNAELLRALGDLNERQQELQRLNQELEDTNRGVLALYAELDEKAESLRHADEMKTRFLSDMSHEFRTPVNAILALSRLLDEWPLTTEARKQLSLIRLAAQDLESLVSDLLDLAKIEAGKIEIRPAEFEVVNLFSALRGMMRPLLVNSAVSLVFESADDLPTMYNDEGKIAQILRNFVSNALKFTERGEVRVSATLGDGGDTIVFAVADTGIGISPADLETIFEEFRQIENPLQATHKGTGLGLPLARRLATLLGGNVTVQSEVGVGSTFRAELPLREAGMPSPAAARASRLAEPPAAGSVTPVKVLTIDDDETARYTLSSFAARPGLTIIEAENGLQGIARAQAERPDVILLDLMMPGIGGHEVLQRLKADPSTAPIPVIVITSRFINDDERQQILARAANVIYKGDLSREVVTRSIEEAATKAAGE